MVHVAFELSGWSSRNRLPPDLRGDEQIHLLISGLATQDSLPHEQTRRVHHNLRAGRRKLWMS